MEKGFSPKHTGYTEQFIKTCRIVPHFPFFRVIIAYYAGKSNEFFAWKCEYFYNSRQKGRPFGRLQDHDTRFCAEFVLVAVSLGAKPKKRQGRFRRGGVLRLVSPATKKGRPFGRPFFVAGAVRFELTTRGFGGQIAIQRKALKSLGFRHRLFR